MRADGYLIEAAIADQAARPWHRRQACRIRVSTRLEVVRIGEHDTTCSGANFLAFFPASDGAVGRC